GNKKKKGANKNDFPKVSETSRTRITRILEVFWKSNDGVYKFKEDLSRFERATVHVLCRRMGMKSKSFGNGQQRRVHVFKLHHSSNSKKKIEEKLHSFRFSEKSSAVLQDLFSRYPPDEVRMTEEGVGGSIRKNKKSQKITDDMFCKPAMSDSDTVNKFESLATRIEKSPSLKQIAQERSKLPIASFKDSITSTIQSHQVVLICGETGCGKTTQVPQFILDHEWSRGNTCKVICTQPRRISATSVAERIASERGENIGDSVGYKIRLESKGGRHSSLVFCTNGILLRVLVSKGPGRSKKKASKSSLNSFLDITHIIVDEIHERDRFSDLMLAIIRDLLPSYPHLRLVLMSATIDAERFSMYFGNCPVIQVPGFTHPVRTFYLEDVLSVVRQGDGEHLSPLSEEFKVALDEAIDSASSNADFDPLLELLSSEGGGLNVFNYQHSRTGVTPLMLFAGKGRVGDIYMLLSFGVDCRIKCKAGKTAYDFAQQENHAEAAEVIRKHMEKAHMDSEEERTLLEKYLSNVNPELTDCILIEQLLGRICSDSTVGAILVFLPGWDDIQRMREKLLSNPFFKDQAKFLILPLHSMVPLTEQKKVFRRPPPGCFKIVLSTNIAETSVTIDDIICVIDSGRMKEKSYDPYINVSSLQSSWISKANARQREGRAGRCRPGVCYHLYSKVRAASLPDYQVPEIKRMPIEELCLQVKLIDPSWKIEEFLQKTMDPPVHDTIHNAIGVLQDIGALSPDEDLTELGQRLGSLPVHPVTSKMLLLSILLNCLDPALTLACASDYKDPFILPMHPDERNKADEAKSELASFYGGRGDHLAVIAAFECWEMAKERGEDAYFCSRYLISPATMKMISRMRNQLESELLRNGFIQDKSSRCSLNKHDPGVLHAVVASALYPRIGKVAPRGKRNFVDTADGNKVRVHPQSTACKPWISSSSSPPPLVMFDEIIRGDGGMHIKNCSFVGCLPFLLLAKEIVVAPGKEEE
ncbi:hypothetical protein M569_05391, partial [Genlisea aurea]